MQDSPYDVVLSYAMQILGRRSHTALQLFQKMRRKYPDVDELTLERVLDRLREMRLVNDEQFARDYARELLLKRHKSPLEVRQRLVSNGIDRDMVDVVLADFFATCEEKTLVQQAAERKYATLQALSPEKQREKLTAFLLRKGFSREHVFAVVAELVGS